MTGDRCGSILAPITTAADVLARRERVTAVVDIASAREAIRGVTTGLVVPHGVLSDPRRATRRFSGAHGSSHYQPTEPRGGGNPNPSSLILGPAQNRHAWIGHPKFRIP